MQAGCQTQNSHNLRSYGNIKAVLARYAVRFAAKADNYVAQLAVIHINNAFPHNAARVDIKRIALLNMVVKHGCQKHMGRCYGMEIAGKMQVNVLHRHNLRIAAACCAALNAHAGAERRFAQGNDNFLPDFGKPLCQAYRSGGFAFTGRGRGNGRNQNKFSVRLILHSFN